MTVFLLNLSAITPDGSINKNIGNTCASPISPKSSGLPVKIYTCQPTVSVIDWIASELNQRIDRNRTKFLFLSKLFEVI